MNAATVYAQTSLHEGRSSTINEAKILNKAIVATNFDSIFEQIQNEVNGVIVEKNPPAIAKAILELINDQQKSQRFSIALSTEKLGTEEEIQKFYELLKA
jgi:glycosyltransferase involved in cell wall biosynthesis